MPQGQLHIIIIHVYSAALILQVPIPPVYSASEGGHLAIVELLVSRGARIDQPCDVRLIIYVHTKNYYWDMPSNLSHKKAQADTECMA